MSRRTDTGNAAPNPPLAFRQRVFVVLLLLFALAVSWLVLRFVDPAVSSSPVLPIPAPHSLPAARPLA